MLKQRIITALILIPLFLLFVFYASPTWFCIGTAVLVVLGAHEWSGLIGVKKFPQTLIYPILITVILWGSMYLNIPITMYVTFAFWITATLLIIIYPKAESRWGNGVVVRSIMGMLVLVPAWLALNFIRNSLGIYDLLFLFVLIWGADTAAYFVGKKWGKHKLAPLVSPGKSWEGFFGALVMTVVLSLMALFYTKTPYSFWIAGLIMTLLTVIFSVIGDLFESMLKRKEGVKDSGFLLPGHGGILDRIDSLTAAAPVFVVGSILLGKIYH